LRKDDKYRFSLQFGADTEENIRAGELLEKLGNRKSTIVVAALVEYMDRHTEIQEPARRIQVKVTPGIQRERLEEMIRSIVEERLAAFQQPDGSEAPDIPGPMADTLQDDIAEMLGNLDVFE
jgi:hypothetical protein